MHYCRFCNNPLTHVFVDLGHQPLSNSFLTSDELELPEITYPLKVYVCDFCWLVQLPTTKNADEIFNEGYAYYSSYSKTMVDHAKEYVDMIIPRLGLNSESQIVEIASNDGYLLRHFPEGFKLLGIEPAEGPVIESRRKGIPTALNFFGTKFITDLYSSSHGVICADLIIANNVLAHVPNLNDFVEALKMALAPDGTITIEVPHLMKLIEGRQFDTIYHEHLSYFSFTTLCRIFGAHGLVVFDVEELTIHGGSLRIYAKHEPSDWFSDKTRELLLREGATGIITPPYYSGFQWKINQVAVSLNSFLIANQELGARIAAYGAAAKFNTLLNYCGVKPYLIPYVCDASPHKQGKFLPGSHILILKPKALKIYRPDYILIAPWNIQDEIIEQLSYVRSWGCKFITAIPRLEVL